MTWIDLIKPLDMQKLIKNHREQEPLKGTQAERDFPPVAKLFVPWGSGTWLISECDPGGIAFGLCDMGFGCPELGSLDLQELADITGPGGLKIEQDIHFTGDKPLSVYAVEAAQVGRITA
jgi:hypothetical protein